MGYPYPRNATYTNPSRRLPFSSADQNDSKYQTRRSNIPGQNNNHSNAIQNHALKDRQCLVSGTLDTQTYHDFDTGSSISLLDEQLQPIQSHRYNLYSFQFQGQMTDLLLHWV